jgi:uncharacterized protein YecA (UPF0149 family)
MHEDAIAKGTIVGGQSPGRNEPCPCGSGLKFKKCHNNPVFKQNAFEEAKKAYAAAMMRQVGEVLARKEEDAEPQQLNVWDVNEQESNEESKHE